MTTYRNPRTEYRFGTIPTGLEKNRLRAATIAAHAALAIAGIVDFPLPKFTPAEKQPDPLGPVNAKRNRDPRRRRWAAAYFLSLIVYGLPMGAYIIPCYLCSQLFDAWSMDGEHIRPSDGARCGNLLLACSGCNTSKGDYAIPNNVTREWLYSLASGQTMPRGSVTLDPMWDRRRRRIDGSEQSSFPWNGMNVVYPD